MSKEDANNIVYTCAEHSLDTYFQVKQFEKKPEAKDYVYVRFKDDEQFESMWVKILQGTQQRGHGKLSNVPVKLLNRQLGDTINYKTDKEGVTWENKN
jgi:uncharacterized protein YegJ (DUF2314 family)